MSVVLVHDYLLVLRGAERTFAAMTDSYPEAPIATLLYDPAGTEGRFAHRRVRTSFLQPVAANQRTFRRWLALLPLAAERLTLGDARVVVSSSSAFAHGVRPPAGAAHVCYCHSPFRYAWHERARAVAELPAAARPAVRSVLAGVRRWDVRASQRVTAYVANSQITRQRIGDFYGREATVIHPPVEVERFTLDPQPRDAFLVVGEVTRHKNTEVALAAAERADVPVVVVGDGPDLDRLRRRYPRAHFAGRVDDARLAELYARCRALVVPAVEEFGITMVEAHAAGRPVLAAGQGGALEIVEDGVAGALVAPGDVDGFAAALRDVDWEGFDPVALRAGARRFSASEFRRRLSAAVDDVGAAGPSSSGAASRPSDLSAAPELVARAAA